GLKRANISTEDLEVLTERSGALFIYAATVVRYIGAYNFSRSVKRLEQILRASTSSNGSDKELNALYTLILREAFDDPNLDDQEKDEMQLVLYTVLCAREPLSVRIMAGILGIERDEFIHAALNPLRSVLDIQKANEGITTLHKSFQDYMFDQARSHRFYCDAEGHHATLAERCFSLMRVPNPPFNICSLQSSYVLDKDISDLGERTERHISGALFYACRYWGTHLELAGTSLGSLDELRSFLSERLLLWMEVMNLKGCLQPGGVNMLITVQNLVEPTRRASLTSGPAPLPIYSIGNRVRCIAFSPDGKQIAAGSDDTTVRIWDPFSGRVIGTPLEGHTGPVCFVAYSHDGKHIASSSTDKTIRVWDAHTGQSSGPPIEGHTGAVFSFVYSQRDSNVIISASEDNTIRYWNVDTGRMRGEPSIGPAESIYTFARSPDHSRQATGYRDGTIRIWDAQAGTIRNELFQGHTGAIYSVAYSPGNSRIVSGSGDHSIRIWNADTGEAVGNPLIGHTAAVCSVAYTPDGARIISGSADNTIRIWDVSSGETVVGPLMGHHGPVHSIACSPDGAIIASASADNTICIWNAITGRIIREPLKWHTRTSHSIAYSTETTSSTSVSGYDIQCSWNTHAGDLRLNPSLQNVVSDAIVVTNPPAPDKANTCYVQDQFIIAESHGLPAQIIRNNSPNHQHEAASSPSRPGPSSSTAGDSTPLTWLFDSKGGVVVDQSQHLFWVPQHARDHIWHPQATGSISRENALWLDLSAILVGEKWHRCYIEPEERGKGDPVACGGRGQESGDPGYPPDSPATPEKDNAATEGGTHGRDQGFGFLVICAVMLVLPVIFAYILR
ncbi:hypothetical protein FRC10_003140, partial [Ceratobasidium sp. 414]